jgi:tellurite methyltransferase
MVRSICHCMEMSEPSPFVEAWVPRLAAVLPPAARALDLAMGHGRHVPTLAAAGFRTFGVDSSWALVREAAGDADQRGTTLLAFCADLTQHPLRRGWFDLVLVTRYLDRERLPDIKAAIAPGGFIIYETFTEQQRALGWGPTSPAHLLRPGELAARFADFEVICSQETARPEAVARLVARQTQPR